MKTKQRILKTTEVKKVNHRNYFAPLLMIFLAMAVVSSHAQSNRLETERGLAEAIAPFDASVRTHILIASEYPQVLTQLKNSQVQTAETFQKTIGRFRQKKQEWFYTITRYPELMHKLANLPSGQKQEDISRLLPHQDPDLKEAAWRLYKSEKKNLAKLDNIRLKADREFEKSTTHLGYRAQEAFHQLQTKPDVLSVLTNNIELTARLGEHYKNNPGEVTSQLASLHDKLEIQNERDAAAFKKQMEDDPKAMKELRQASNAYGTNSYYGPNYYPYSYWFGYPYWYSYPMWYPGMYWYYPGFYFGMGGLYGFPSYGFSFWFYNGGYYTRYPHLYRQFGRYYQHNFATVRPSMSVANRGFMNVATSHYRPNARINSISPYLYNGPSHLNRVNPSARFNQNTYRAPSFGGQRMMGGSMGGGFHGGGGMHMGRH